MVLKGLNHPFGLALYGDYLYWTDLIDGVVRAVNRTSSEGVVTLADDLDSVLDIEVFSRDKTRPGGCVGVSVGLRT